jgi:hypothetical protein
VSDSNQPGASDIAPAVCPASAWIAVLRQDGQRLRAAVEGLTDQGPWEFAFYLMHGRERRSVSWYLPQSEVDFDGPHAPGAYHVMAFVRRPAARSGVSRPSTVVVVAPPAQDASAAGLPIHEHADEAAFANQMVLGDGIHRIGMCGTSPLEMLLEGFVPRRRGAVIVCFSAAVQRARVTGPVFSGRTLATQLGLPLAAVADPQLAVDPDLNLAWYAGSAAMPRLSRRIAALIDHLAAIAGAQLMLIGGSGGGFAALAVLDHLRSPASAYVWNPQTSITRYYPRSWRQYARSALPQLSRAVVEPTADLAAAALSAADIEHDLTARPRYGGHLIVYLQNCSDAFHADNHLRQYAAVNGLADIVLGVTFAAGPRLCVWLGNWGDGHVSPPPALTARVLRRMAANTSIEDIGLLLSDEHARREVGRL